MARVNLSGWVLDGTTVTKTEIDADGVWVLKGQEALDDSKDFEMVFALGTGDASTATVSIGYRLPGTTDDPVEVASATLSLAADAIQTLATTLQGPWEWCILVASLPAATTFRALVAQ